MSVVASFRVEPIVPGVCRGKLVVVNRYISFFGEVDPEKGLLKEESVSLKDAVLAFKGTRGSTVAPYILYAMSKSSNKIACILVEEAEPMLVTGCVLSEIPLYKITNLGMLLKLNGYYVEVLNNELRVFKY